MAIVAPQEEAPADDVLIWRYAATRAHQAAEEARARAREAAERERSERRLLPPIGPTLERAVKGVRRPRPAGRVVRVNGPAATSVAAGDPRAAAVGAAEDAPAERPATSSLATPPSLAVWTQSSETAGEQASWRSASQVAESQLTSSLADILASSATVPLPAALLFYDDVLEALQRLHASGATHGGVTSSAVVVDGDGYCRLSDPIATSRAGLAAFSPMPDLRAATGVFVEAAAGLHLPSGVSSGGAWSRQQLAPLLLAALPLPARCLVEETLVVEAASATLTAARLRSDLAVAARAFLQEEWETGARAWLASAAAAATGVELLGSAAQPDSAPRAPERAAKRPLLFGGVTRRDTRLMIGLGIAASASITLVVGAAVGLTGSRTPSQTVAQHPAAVAPAPSVIPTAAPSAPAAIAPTTPAAATPTPAPPTTPPTASAAPATPPQQPAPVMLGPVTFTPVPAPPPPTVPKPAPTPPPAPACLLGIVCSG